MTMKKALPVILKYGAFLLLFGACLLCSWIYPKNSDSTITSAMAQDIVNGNIFLKDWYISTRSDYFTDVFLHSLVYFFVRNMYDTAFITSTIIAFLFFLCGYAVYKKIMKEKECWILFIGLSFIYLLGSEIWVVFSPMHVSTIACCLLALYFYFNDSRWAKGLFFLLLFIVFVSDNYAVIYLALPILIENAIYFTRTQKADMKFLFIFVALGLAYLFNSYIEEIGYTVPGISLSFVSREEFGKKLTYLFWAPEDYFHVNFWGQPIKFSLDLLWSLFYAGFGILLLLVHFYATLKYKLNNRIITILLISSITVTSALTLTNLELSPRYYAGVLFNGFLLLCVILSSYKINPKWLSILGISLLLIGGYRILEKYNKTTTQITPEQEITDIIKNNHLQYGIAAFWNAYNLNLLLNENRIIAILSQGEMYPWLTKDTWYDRPIEFALTKKVVTDTDITQYLPEETIKSFEKVKKELETEDYKIFIYEKPVYLKHNFYKGIELPTTIKRKNYDDGSIEANHTSAGFLTYGPYINMKRGKYKAIINYESVDADNSYFEITKDNGETILNRQNLPQNATQAEVDFKIKSKYDTLEFRTFYAGKGILRVNSIKICHE